MPATSRHLPGRDSKARRFNLPVGVHWPVSPRKGEPEVSVLLRSFSAVDRVKRQASEILGTVSPCTQFAGASTLMYGASQTSKLPNATGIERSRPFPVK